MKPLSALVFVLGASISVEAGLVGLRDAFFGTGLYAIAPLNRRAGGIENPERCLGILNDKRFQPHQPNECRILETQEGSDMNHAAWNYCPADPNANCQIPMACVDEDLCKDNKCGIFGNKDYTTISCSDSFHCGHTAIVDPIQRGLDATRWVCNKTPGFAMTLAGKMKVNNNQRTFDGKGAQVVIGTTSFDVTRTSSSESSSTESSSSTLTSASDSSTITAGPSISVTTATVIPEPTSSLATEEPKTNMAPIIGGAVGGVAALALLGLAFFLWRRHKRNSVNTFTAVPFANSSSSSSEKDPNVSGHGNGQRTPLSQWMPTPASTQGTWTPNDPTAGGPNGTYSGTVSEMPTPDLLGRDWNQSSQPVEIETPTPTIKAWGGGHLQDVPTAQNWNGPVDPHKFGPYGASQKHPAVAPGGLPVSLTPGRRDTERAELA